MNIHDIPSPAYVLEERRLIRNLEVLQAVQERANVSIILALKAFALWRVFPLIGQYLGGATASSLNEARLIFEEMGVPAHTYSPAYLPEEFEALMRYSSHITFNSLSEYQRYCKQLQGTSVSAGIRVNPEYSEVATELYNPADPTGRLGETAPNVQRLPRGVEGLHVHTLCESSPAATAHLVRTTEEKFGFLFPRLKWINFGGGHLMTRAGYELDRLVDTLQSFHQRHPHLEVIMEPGSAIAWETGVLVSRVLDIIENQGVKTLLLDISFTAHLPDTLEMPYRPRLNLVRPGGQSMSATAEPQAHHFRYRLGGVSCLAGDYLAEYGFEAPVEVGDRLVFQDMIHYTMVKTTMFNGVKHPSIAIERTDGNLEVVRTFSYEDYKSRMG